MNTVKYKSEERTVNFFFWEKFSIILFLKQDLLDVMIQALIMYPQTFHCMPKSSDIQRAARRGVRMLPYTSSDYIEFEFTS